MECPININFENNPNRGQVTITAVNESNRKGIMVNGHQVSNGHVILIVSYLIATYAIRNNIDSVEEMFHILGTNIDDIKAHDGIVETMDDVPHTIIEFIFNGAKFTPLINATDNDILCIVNAIVSQMSSQMHPLMVMFMKNDIEQTVDEMLNNDIDQVMESKLQDLIDHMD